MKNKFQTLFVTAMLAILGFQASASSALVQDSAKTQKQESARKKKTKKKPAPFSWVNPPSPANQKLPGIKHDTFDSSIVGEKVGYCIYLPDAYQNDSKAKFPVVYYLHGGRPGSEKKSIKLASMIDREIKSGDVPPMIYVFVNGGPVSHYNVPSVPAIGQLPSRGADVFITELIPHIDANYRTIADRKGRGLEGFSQGGRGTARLMFRHPELFCSASPGGGGHEAEKRISDSGGFENEKLKFSKGDNTWDLANAYSQRKSPAETEVKILVHVGDKGFNYENNLRWMTHLDSLEIEHEKVIVPGAGHSAMQIYEKESNRIMSFHAKNFGLLEPGKEDEKKKEKKKDSKLNKPQIKSADNKTPALLRKVFPKSVSVFGVAILATESTGDEKINHAAAVLADFLDNDRDGVSDNPKVVEALVENRGTVLMFASEKESEKLERELFRPENEKELDQISAVALYDSETHPGGAARGEFDASLEEILHLITSAGYANAYPDVFGETSDSKLGQAMDLARGGKFKRVPREYPDEAWFTYDDRTCDYSCMCTEYIYWGLTSILGGQEFEGRFDEIRHEWRLNTREKMKAGDPALFALLTDKQYGFAERLPDGEYFDN